MLSDICSAVFVAESSSCQMSDKDKNINSEMTYGTIMKLITYSHTVMCFSHCFKRVVLSGIVNCVNEDSFILFCESVFGAVSIDGPVVFTSVHLLYSPNFDIDEKCVSELKH